MTVAWVIGSSGLLGSALVRVLKRNGRVLFSPERRLDWTRDLELSGQIGAGLAAFAARASAGPGWEIYWAAGVGTMGSLAGDLERETKALAYLVQQIQTHAGLGSTPGAVAFASSAGAIYANARDEIITEATPVAPTTAYARAKLAQEAVLEGFAAGGFGTRVLIARLTTIYGPGQAAGKKQGLLAHIARCIVSNRPIQIFVPFDTIRDYVFVDDAAQMMVSALPVDGQGSLCRVKIIGAEKPVTIAEIVSVFKKISRRTPRIVTSASALGSLYTRRIQFRSLHPPEGAHPAQTSLLIGISQLLAAERLAFAAGARSTPR
jgi:UDP-glucose 4-epimerase